MTMICKYCKIEVQEDSNFCNKCGAKVHREAKCPNIINDVVCDTLISSNESVCPHCNWSITEKAFETGTRMCNAFKDEMPCKHLVAQEDDCCSKCGSIRETLSKTDKSEDLNSSECNAGKVVDSDFCLTDEKDKSDTNNTITKEGQNEETPKEFTANCESGVNKIADYTPLTLDEKTKSDKHEKNEEFESNFHSVNDANMSENESIRTNIHRQREDEIQSYLQHVSKSKKENENNSESNLQAAGKTIYHPEEGLENQALPMVPNPTQNKVTDDVESKGNINAKGNERDTTIYEEGGKQSADGIKLNYSEEAEPICQGNIAEETIDEIRNPDNTYSCSPPIGHFHQTVIKSRTENKYDDSSRQDGTESNEGSSVDQFTQNTGKKDNGGTVMQASPRGPNPIQYKVTDDVRSGDNMNSKAKEHDTGNREETGNQSEDGIKLTYSEEAEPSSQGNIAVKKHFVHGNSSRQEGMESKEGSSVDQFTQNTGKKDIGGAEMQTLSSMPNLIQNNLENVDGITIVFHAEASDPFLKGPCVKFGIAFENPYKGSKWCYYPGEIERNISDKSWLISVTVRFERKLLCQGVCYQYYRYPDNETDLCEFGDYYAVKMSFRRLKLTREDSSRDYLTIAG